MIKLKKSIQALFLYSLCLSVQAAVSKNNLIKAYNAGLRYSIVPWLKEYIFVKRGSIDSNIDIILSDVVMEVGAKNFEGLDLRVLVKSGSSTLRYIAAKKLVKKSEYSKAKILLSQISKDSIIFPMAQNFLGTLSYLKKKYTQSLSYYESCLADSKTKMANAKNSQQYKQLKINRDICITGKARVYYAKKAYKKADDLYLDLEKKSIVWPPILLEEAWSSYYAKNYNRTLGKLVTYNAPLLRYVTNPEIYVLKAMTYLKMCLYGDVQKVVEKFYRNFEGVTASLEKELSQTKDTMYFYKKVMNYKQIQPEQAMYFYKGIYKSPNVKAYMKNIEEAKKELSRTSRFRSKKNALNANISEFINTQKQVIGQHAYAKLSKLSYDLRKSFQAMSYMKLEVLGRKKEAIYEDKELGGKRGDVKYLKRSDRQYFWNFIGEFWGDELGDYVFTLAVECPDNES